MRKTITTAAITAAGAGQSVPELADVTGGSEKSRESREPVRARGRTGCPTPRPHDDNNKENQMPATRSASSTLRRIIKRTVAVGALVTIVGGGVVGGTAHAWTNPGLPDLVASGPTYVIIGNGTGSSLIADVKNDVNVNNRSASAQASNATIKYQPLTRLGKDRYINTPGSTAITATGTVGFLAAGANASFVASSDRTPSGLNRITVCADSKGLVFEQSEVNNCYSEVKTVVAIYFG